MKTDSLNSCAPPVPAERVWPCSPLGWSMWLRLGMAAGACALLWAVVLWALD